MRAWEVIVGTDGTACGQAAVEWAAREAVHRRAPLRIVHAFDWQWEAARYDPCSESLDVARLLADTVIAHATAQARAAAPEVEVEADALIGDPAARLLEVAGDAALVVLGNRGRGGVASLLLGSVSQRVATHAPGPVVVVRGRTSAAGGPVVVGLDDSDTNEQVLRTAFQTAADRGAALVVVRAYLPVTPPWFGDRPPLTISTPEQDDDEHARVEQVLGPWREKFPGVPVEALVAHGSPAAVLAGVSSTAQLVMVGSRGRGSVAGSLLGSTGIQLLHHADCPVWIARPVPDGSR